MFLQKVSVIIRQKLSAETSFGRSLLQKQINVEVADPSWEDAVRVNF